MAGYNTRALFRRVDHLLNKDLAYDFLTDVEYKGSGIENDPFIVDWMLRDSVNPLEFTSNRKWGFAFISSISALSVAFASSVYSGGSKSIISDFDALQHVVILGLSLFVLGLAIGPLLWGPLSEVYGRKYVFSFTYAVLTVFSVATVVAPNVQSLIIFRFLAGAFGSSYQTNAGGVIADMFEAGERGLALTIFAAAPVLGPVIAPIVSGFVDQSLGWRWVQDVMAIFVGAVCLMGVILIAETYAPVLFRRRAAHLSELTRKHYKSDTDVRLGKTSAREAFQRALSRPWILLFREPIVLLLSIYVAPLRLSQILYGILYMLFPAFPIVYQEAREWSNSIGGLVFISLAVRMMGAVVYSIFENRRYNSILEQSASGHAEPEARLRPSIIGAIAIPIGLFWFARTNSASIYWLTSIAAGVPLGFGVVLVILSITNYLIDSYTVYAASVLAANAVLRSIFGAVLPLFTTQMYRSLGIHWASTAPAFFSLACVPVPFLFYIFGSLIRARNTFSLDSGNLRDRQPRAATQMSTDGGEQA